MMRVRSKTIIILRARFLSGGLFPKRLLFYSLLSVLPSRMMLEECSWSLFMAVVCASDLRDETRNSSRIRRRDRYAPSLFPPTPLTYDDATGSTTISFILPALFFLSLFRNSTDPFDRKLLYVAGALLVWGVVVMITALSLNICTFFFPLFFNLLFSVFPSRVMDADARGGR